MTSQPADPPRVLVLPGWQNSGPTHWQSRWEAAEGFERVQQADWQWPRRGDWMARLEEVLLAQGPQRGPAVLVAHSLGCQLVAAWAAHTQHPGLVRAALLVAPPDAERSDMPPQLASWRPIVRRALPFPTVVLYSEDDPYCAAERAIDLAADWGARAYGVGAAGHINGESGLGDWPQGRSFLQALLQAPG